VSDDEGGPFRLDETYAFLKDDGAAPLVPTTGLWQELMSGQPKSPGARLVADGEGWLLAMYSIDGDTPAWEMHPAGDELLTMLSGEMDVVLERDGREVTIHVHTGETCLVPRGTWHRQAVRRAGRYLGITYGKGTEHRKR
jgi:mannose-6-phosphate isomerase-like protein (cupin superfamily)